MVEEWTKDDSRGESEGGLSKKGFSHFINALETIFGIFFDWNDTRSAVSTFKSEPESGWITHPLSR